MHPTDQFDVLHTLHTRKGMPAEDIAARFGVTKAVVQQRLKLACVSPKLIAAHRAGEMTLDQLSGFTVSDDVQLQERVWEDSPGYASRQDIVAALSEAHVPASDPRAVCVGAAAYGAAGGVIVKDLFDEAGGCFADAELLCRLARAKLETTAETVPEPRDLIAGGAEQELNGAGDQQTDAPGAKGNGKLPSNAEQTVRGRGAPDAAVRELSPILTVARMRRTTDPAETLLATKGCS